MRFQGILMTHTSNLTEQGQAQTSDPESNLNALANEG